MKTMGLMFLLLATGFNTQALAAEPMSCESAEQKLTHDGLPTSLTFEQTEYVNAHNKKIATLEGRLFFRMDNCWHEDYTMANLMPLATLQLKNGRTVLVQVGSAEPNDGVIFKHIVSDEEPEKKYFVTYNYPTNAYKETFLSVHPTVLASLILDIGFDALSLPSTDKLRLSNAIDGRALPIKFRNAAVYLGDVMKDDRIYRTEVTALSIEWP